MSNWAVLESTVEVAIVMPLAPRRIRPTSLCSSHSTTNLRQSICQRDPQLVSVQLCVLLTSLCFLLVFVPLHLVKSFLSFLAVLLTLSFVFVLGLCPCQACLCPCLCRICPCQACLWFCRPCQTIHPFDCFARIQLSSDYLSPCDRKFHTMNNFP